MIRNERQYKITKAEAAKFAHALDTFDAKAATLPAADPRLLTAEREALLSQLNELHAQLQEYDRLKKGEMPFLEITSLDELPQALVSARIASGLSQKQLAEKVGMKEQQVQRYEATDYQSASLKRLSQIAAAIGVQFREEVFLPISGDAITRLYSRLQDIGFPTPFVIDRLIPRSLRDELELDTADAASKFVSSLTNALSRVFKWSPSGVLADGELPLDQSIISAARYKVAKRAEAKHITVYSIYANYLAMQVLRGTEHIPTQSLPTDAEEFYTNVAVAHGEVTFSTVLQYIWSLGVAVLPLNDAGAFHGACWRTEGRNVVVLKQRTASLARWMFDLLHEYFHAAQHPELTEFALIEAPETSEQRRTADEEIAASQFAGDVILAGNAEHLADTCVEAAHHKLQRLKSVVPRIAREHNVSVDALANYLAFRLSLQGENWWGSARNLQETDESPWLIARDALLQRLDFERLAPADQELLQTALTD